MNKLLDNIRTERLIELLYTLDSEADGIEIINRDHHRFFRVKIDSETIVFDSEGQLMVNIDDETLVYKEDSEGVFKLRVPIDNETIRINSEGLLEADALPKPYVADTFLYIPEDSEGNPGEPE